MAGLRLRGLVSRLAWPSRIVVYAAPSLEHDTPGGNRAGFRLARLRERVGDEIQSLVAEAMRAAGEPDDLLPRRLASGDECFCWRSDQQVVCFGWVAHGNRKISSVPLLDAPGRAFLYNFHTLEPFRGMGLYPELLLAMRKQLGGEQVSEFIIDVNTRNGASTRAVQKAGFEPVARLLLVTILRRWVFLARHTRLRSLSHPLLACDMP